MIKSGLHHSPAGSEELTIGWSMDEGPAVL